MSELPLFTRVADDRIANLESENAQLRAELDAATTYGLFQANNCDVLQSQLKKIEAELAALGKQEPVAWIVEHDDYPTEVELINELDHAPEIIGQEEAMGWRFTQLYTAPQPAIPEGFALVPVEPTPEILDRGVAFALNVTLSGDYTWSDYIADMYRHMLAAKENNHD
jgi:hypothetical protein